MGIYTIPVLLLDTRAKQGSPQFAALGAKLALFPRAGREHRLEGI